MTASNADNYFSNPGPDYNGFGNPNLNPSAENPSLLPQFDPVAGGSAFDFVAVATFLQQNPRASATATATLGGSVTANDTVAAALSNLAFPNGGVVVTVGAGGSDTATTLAAKLAAAINTNAVLRSYGVYATAAGAVLSVFHPGPLGNLTTLQVWSYTNKTTATVAGSVTTADVMSLVFSTLSAPNTGVLTLSGTPHTGDVLTVKFEHPSLPNGSASATYTVAGGNALADIAAGIQSAIAALSALAPLLLTSNALGASVYLAWSGAIGTVYVSSSFANTVTEALALAYNAGSQAFLGPAPVPTETVTITGTGTAGDILELILNSPVFSGPVNASYTVGGGDSTTVMATGLAAAINALALPGLSATSSTNVVSLQWQVDMYGNLGFVAKVLSPTTEAVAYAYAPASITVSYTAAVSDTTTLVATGLKNAVNANAILAALGIVATSSGAVVTLFTNTGLAIPVITKTLSVGATETVTLANASTASTFTVGGTALAGDIITLTFNTAYGPFTVTYTAIGGDTLNSIATALGAAVNAAPQLLQFGFAATVSSAVVTVRWNGNAGNVTLAQAVTRGSGSPTTTITIGGNTESSTTATLAPTSGLLAGGTGPVMPTADFIFANSDAYGGGASTTQSYRKGLPALVDYNTLSLMVAAGLPIS